MTAGLCWSDNQGMTVSVTEAGANLDWFLDKAVAGEEVIIVRGDNRLVRMEPLAAAAEPVRRKRQLGTAKGLVFAGPDFHEPLPDDIIAEFEK